jgi:hypothetical protein
MLVERPGEIITREEVRQRLWPENTFVEFDDSLGVAIRKVRDSLNDDADSPRYVETVPRRGYRFVAPVKVEEPVRSPPLLPTPGLAAPVVAITESPISSPTLSIGAALARDRSLHQRTYWLAAALAVLFVAGTIYIFRARALRPATSVESTGAETPLRIRRSVAILGFRNLLGRSEDNWLSPALAEMLNTELAANGALRMVPARMLPASNANCPFPTKTPSGRQPWVTRPIFCTKWSVSVTPL